MGAGAAYSQPRPPPLIDFAPMQQFILDIRLDTPPSFDNYLPGPNQEALAALRQHDGRQSDPVLFLWGEPGCGKSHLLQAWAALHGASRDLDPDDELRPRVVDDVQQLDAEAQVRLFALLNLAREHSIPLLISGAQPPMQLGLRADLATRLAQGLVLRLLPLSDADKAQAIAIRAEALGLNLPEEVSRYLISHCQRDLPSLLATVDALDAYSLSRKRAASVPLLKEMLAAG